MGTGLRRLDPVLTALALTVVVGLVVGIWVGARQERPAEVPSADGAADLGAVLGDGNGSIPSGFKRVTGPRPFSFPEDHGAHPDYRSEWWYFTGNLETRDGRAFGFQLTFFRFALAPGNSQRPSDWATNQAWMAHLAITDVAGGTHRAVERFQRGALGLAGAKTAPFRVWLDDWQAAATGDGPFPLRLRANGEDLALDLTLTAEKPRVLQGDAGYSAKSAEPGNASYYYSYTRLRAEGEISAGGDRHTVTGAAWLDREWSTSALAPDQAGWDWFSLQLDDGRDLMVYRLRRRDGSAHPASAGVLVDRDGNKVTLAAGDFRVTPRRWWRSEATGVRYPVAWRVTLPEEGLDLTVQPRLDGQEMNLSVRYWEGAVTARGHAGDRPVSGRGYLELAGYGQ